MTEYELGLREAGDEELEAIIQKTEKHLPHSFTVYNLLSIGFRRKLVDRSYTRIYLPVSEKIPFFIIITGVITKPIWNNLTPYWDPDEISFENAKTLLKSLPNWDWERPVLFNQTSLRTVKEVDRMMLGEGGLCNNKLYLDAEDGYTYTLSPENIKCKRILDKDISLSKLNEDYAPLVFKHWIYCNDSVEGVRGYMKSLPSMAAFAKIDSNENCENQDLNLSKEGNTLDEQYKPVTWAVCRFYGEIGFTHTLPEYRNKGLCAAVTLELAKELIQMNIKPYVNITGGNKPYAVKSHKNIGLEEYCPVGYHAFLSEGMKWRCY